MPIFFLGHGSPMNALLDSNYSRSLAKIGKTIPKPKAILVISAHWITQGTWITEMENPKTIHDFYGFPQDLYNIQYPAPGSPEISKHIRNILSDLNIQADFNWGLDHGTWSILKHMFPEAIIPVLQLSLDISKPLDYHFKFGKRLSQLRNNGILIIASGNLIHNLQKIHWEPNAKPYDWALEFNNWLKEKFLSREFELLIKDFHNSVSGKLSVPTLDHYIPLHYVLGAANIQDKLKIEYDEIQNASISMLSFRIG